MSQSRIPLEPNNYKKENNQVGAQRNMRNATVHRMNLNKVDVTQVNWATNKLQHGRSPKTRREFFTQKTAARIHESQADDSFLDPVKLCLRALAKPQQLRQLGLVIDKVAS